jgi:signal transduction histidine kinase
VVVSLEHAADGLVEVSITDHGPGVDESLRKTLFSGLRTLPGAGDGSRRTGLGLALVKGLVEAMGGTVGYEPAAAGARFVVSLPQPRRA